MQIEYKRSYDKSYMVVSSNEVMQTFEKNMLLRGHFKSILVASIQSVDEKEDFWYDISGLEPLKMRLEYGRFQREHMLMLMTHLSYAIAELQEYLLDTAHLLLDVETIFFDRNGKNVLFAFYPCDRESFEEGMRHLMEGIVRGLGPGEGRFIADVYRIFDIVRTDTFFLDELIDLLKQGEKFEPEIKEAESVAVAEVIPIDEARTPFDFNSVYDEKVPKEKHKPSGILDFFKRNDKSAALKPKRRKEEDLLMVCEEPVAYKPRETELLTGPMLSCSRLRYAGRRGMPDIILEGDVIKIGSGAEENDIRLDSVTVSKIHARITNTSVGVFIEDFNSTNGTFVNERPLNYQEKCMISRGDQIRFADELYIME